MNLIFHCLDLLQGSLCRLHSGYFSVFYLSAQFQGSVI